MTRGSKPNKFSFSSWTSAERRLFASLTTPRRIQDFLDTIAYSAESRYRSPRTVIRDRKGHCFDGAVFAAAALREIGHPPVIVDMQAVRDDDHVIAIFRANGRYGAVAKSNFSGLRFREPVYRSIRELVMSYYDPFYNLNRERSLRQFARPLNLKVYDRLHWTTDDATMEVIGQRLCDLPVTKLLTPAMVRSLTRVDKRTYDAGMLGVNLKGVYKP
jgi:hypothetical protein